MTGQQDRDDPDEPSSLKGIEPVAGFFGEYRFLSNFWPAIVEHDGRCYPSVEHAYQAAKSLVETDREKIEMVGSPGAAKRLAREFETRPDRIDIRVEVMLDLVRQKFTKHSALKELLLATGIAELIESNTWGTPSVESAMVGATIALVGFSCR